MHVTQKTINDAIPLSQAKIISKKEKNEAIQDIAKSQACLDHKCNLLQYNG